MFLKATQVLAYLGRFAFHVRKRHSWLYQLFWTSSSLVYNNRMVADRL